MDYCQKCGNQKPNLLQKALTLGVTYELHECPICGLTFCTQCGVYDNKAAWRFIAPHTLKKVVKCPDCNPGGFRFNPPK